MNINTLEDFIYLIEEDEYFYNILSGDFGKYYEHFLEIVPLSQVNKKAAKYLWDELISNAYTDDIYFDEVIKEDVITYFENEFEVTVAFAKGGSIF